MAKRTKTRQKAKKTVSLTKHFNWPRRVPKAEFWQKLAEHVRAFPTGKQTSWGIPFRMALPRGCRVILLAADRPDVVIRLDRTATHVCFLHSWHS